MLTRTETDKVDIAAPTDPKCFIKIIFPTVFKAPAIIPP